MRRDWMRYKWLGLIVVLSVVSYVPLLESFFQQDEWLAFGRHIVVEREGWSSVFYNTFLVPGGHFSPLNFITIHLLFKLFHLNFVPYAISSLFLHTLVVVGVYHLAKVLTNSSFLSGLAALFFGIFASHFQASTWVVADIGTHGATLFGIISLIFFYKYLLNKRDSNFVFSISFLLISLLFKEITIGLLPLYCVVLLVDKNIHQTRSYKILTIVFIGILYMLLRLFISSGTDFYGNQVNFNKRPDRVAYNLVTLPHKSIIQGVIPSDQLVSLSYWISSLIPQDIAGVSNTPEHNLFTEKKVFEIVNIVFFLAIFLIVISCIRKNNLTYRLLLSAYVLFIIFASAIFAFAPEKDGVINIIDSRNLYFANVFTVIILVVLLKEITYKRPWLLITLCLLVTFVNLIWLENKISSLRASGKIKKDILNSIKNTNPIVENNLIIYTESDKALYGLPEDQKILPFQSGLGQTLLIWYSTNNYIPSEFFKNRFLWEITEEGYKEVEGIGFGYYRNFNNMAKTVKDGGIEESKIFAFRYDTDTLVLKDITPQIRGRLLSYAAPKKEILLNIQKITPSENIEKGNLLVDSNTQTYWNSDATYRIGQKILIELDKIYNLAQIDIVSESKDKNRTGLRILVSKDNRLWEEVLLSQSLIWNNYLASLYFQPIRAKYIKILQIGHHEYAQWVINELRLYEAIN